MYQE
jgi:hypothetical protein